MGHFECKNKMRPGVWTPATHTPFHSNQVIEFTVDFVMQET